MPFSPAVHNEAANHNENHSIEFFYYPLVGMMLREIFTEQRYIICPQWPVQRNGRLETIDFVVRAQGQPWAQPPLLLVEIKAPDHFHTQSGREAAVTQIMERLNTIGPTVHYAERLYAISIIGIRWRAYYTPSERGSQYARSVRRVTATSSVRSSAEKFWNENITAGPSFLVLRRIERTIRRYL